MNEKQTTKILEILDHVNKFHSSGLIDCQRADLSKVRQFVIQVQEAKKAIQVEHDKFLTKPKENEYTRWGLEFALSKLKALGKKVEEK